MIYVQKIVYQHLYNIFVSLLLEFGLDWSALILSTIIWPHARYSPLASFSKHAAGEEFYQLRV